MKRILQFDRIGRLMMIYDSYEDARKAMYSEVQRKQIREMPNNPNRFSVGSHKIFVARCLFRETSTANGYIFTFDDDERIVKDSFGNITLDCLEGEPTPFDENDEVLFTYKPVEKKYDNLASSSRCIICKREKWNGELEILLAKTVADAKRITGAKYVWGALMGENKTSNGWRFEFSQIQ